VHCVYLSHGEKKWRAVVNTVMSIRVPENVENFLTILGTVSFFGRAVFHGPVPVRGLRRRSAAACLLRLWVRIPLGAWTFVCCECYVLSGRGPCDELITRPEESYQLWCVVGCDLETSQGRPRPTQGCRADGWWWWWRCSLSITHQQMH
jgi:hypothetical protein